MTPDDSNTGAEIGVATLDLASEVTEFGRHKPWRSGMFSKLLYKAPDLRLVLIAMESGAKMKEHHADGTISIHALRGSLSARVDGQARILHAEQILTIAPGIKHDVEAHEDSVFPLTISPASSEKADS